MLEARGSDQQSGTCQVQSPLRKEALPTTVPGSESNPELPTLGMFTVKFKHQSRPLSSPMVATSSAAADREGASLSKIAAKPSAQDPGSGKGSRQSWGQFGRLHADMLTQLV